MEEFLTGTRERVGAERVLATILFTDIVASTRLAAELGDRRWRDVLDDHDEMVRRQLARVRGKEIKSTGDGFVAIFDGPARAIHCTRDIAVDAAALGIEIRAGVHTGECEVRDDDIRGIAVHVAARILGEAAPGEVIVSSTVKELVTGSGLRFTDRGTRILRGVPDEWRLFAVASDDRPCA
jgi:class 3 adenylate cyclase